MNEHTYIVIGLGNKGSEYSITRHNAGQIILDELLGASDFEYDKYIHSDRAELSTNHGSIICIKPDTYMNESGQVIPLLIKKYGAVVPIIIHDELDTNLGEIKLSTVRGAGGHNGVKSILEYLPENTVSLRIRIGIAQVHDERIVKPNVLDNFNSDELQTIKQLAPQIKLVLEMITERGIDYAVSAYSNKK